MLINVARLHARLPERGGGLTAEEVAREFLVWAANSGMVSRDRLGGGAPRDALPTRLEGINLVAASEILQRRRLHFIGFNNPKKEVVVYTRARILRRELDELPQEVAGVKVSYLRADAASVGEVPSAPLGVGPYFVHKGKYTCGSSIHVANQIGAGTLGCLVTDGQGKMYGLSNNHVTGSCNYAEPGLPILAPGPLDVVAQGLDPFTIGHHTRLKPMVMGLPENVDVRENTDAAIFLVKDKDRVSTSQRGAHDTPVKVRAIEPNMAVEKAGRTTGMTKGYVRAQSIGPQDVYYAISTLDLKAVIYFEPIYVIEAVGDAPFADLGDSGSLVTYVDGNGTRHAVGILVAVSTESTGQNLAYALPIVPILDYFGVRLLAGHNV